MIRADQATVVFGPGLHPCSRPRSPLQHNLSAMRDLMLPLILLSGWWIPTEGLYAQGSSSTSSLDPGFHWEGLYPGMRAEKMATMLGVADHWRRWCRSLGEGRPVCGIEGDWTKYDSRNIRFGIGLSADSTRVTMVTVTLNVAARDRAVAIIRPHLARWSAKYPPLRGPGHSWMDNVCFFSSQSEAWTTWTIGVTCWDNRQNVIRDGHSPVQLVELTFTLWNPDKEAPLETHTKLASHVSDNGGHGFHTPTFFWPAPHFLVSQHSLSPGRSRGPFPEPNDSIQPRATVRPDSTSERNPRHR